MLSNDEFSRYAQQLKLPNLGVAEQLKLKNKSVLCVGAGGLGSSLLFYLAATGLGKIGIVDEDVVELSNLHRQILYNESHLGLKKVAAAKDQLSKLNSHLTIEVFPVRLDEENIEKIIKHYDIVADCSDNFVTRYLINDYCFKLAKPYAFASIMQFKGQFAFFTGQYGPCLRCLFPTISEEVPDCSTGGVLGVLPGMLGIMQATEIIKWALNWDGLLQQQLMTVDMLQMQFNHYQLVRDPTCSVCTCHSREGGNPSLYNAHTISVLELNELLKQNKNTLLLDVRTPAEHAADNIGGMLLPLDELLSNCTQIDKNEDVVIYCRSGIRSAKAAEFLLNKGFSSVRYLSGGLAAWRKVVAKQP